MKRRSFMAGAAGTAASIVLLPRQAYADAGRIDWFTSSSDTTIQEFFANFVRPKFEAENPGITLNIVSAGNDLDTIAGRALAALKTGSDPHADIFDEYNPRFPDGAIEAGLWVDFSKANLANYGKINPITQDIAYDLPYRGSQVVLAYDTTKLKQSDAPTDWATLVAWIKANPGQFVYCRPDKGGSGNYFIQRAIYQANGLDPTKFTVENYSPELAQKLLPPAWDLLNNLAPYLFGKGAYTSGNTQSLTLLSQGAVSMISAWSDQLLSYIKQGVLPDTTGLLQLQDLAIPGGYAQMVVFNNGANRDAALKLCDFLLTPEIQASIINELGGFPAIKWEYLPTELQKKFAQVISSSMPHFPDGPWDDAVVDGWYRNVAPGVDRNS